MSAKVTTVKQMAQLGGRARAKALPAARRREIATKASHAAHKKMTPEQRRERARKAGQASAEKRRKG